MEPKGSLSRSQLPATCPHILRITEDKSIKPASERLFVTTVRRWKGDISVAVLSGMFFVSYVQVEAYCTVQSSKECDACRLTFRNLASYI